MTPRLALVLSLALAACSKDTGGGSGSAGSAGVAASGSGIAAQKKGAGFAASLSAEMAKEGSAAPSVAMNEAPPAAAPSGGSAAGSAAGSAVGSHAGSNVSSTAGPNVGSAAGTAPAAKLPTTAAAAAPATTTATTGPAATTKPAVTPAGAVERPSDRRAPVKPPPELAAIKMDLEPNWDRDYDEAGTISFVLKVPSTNDTRLFNFHYGYDPDGAPSDRDQYMAWLGSQKLLDVTLNRQRGAAWYLEGTDGRGAPAFRYLVMYGGKHLVCGGSLYKDAASNPLGDLRDKVVMAAKKICETMTL